MKLRTSYLAIYSTRFIFIDTDSKEKIKEKFDIEFNEVGGVVYLEDTGIYVMINTKYEHWDMGVLVHECVHAASELFKRINTPHKLNNEEHYAYAVEWIFKEAYKKLIIN